MVKHPQELLEATPENHTLFTFKDGSVFGVSDTKQPYVRWESFETGGYKINQWSWSIATWTYVDNSPNLDTLFNFLKALERRHGPCL